MYLGARLFATSLVTERAKMIPVGLEPTIPGSVGRCLVHWATGPIAGTALLHMPRGCVHGAALAGAWLCHGGGLIPLPPPITEEGAKKFLR